MTFKPGYSGSRRPGDATKPCPISKKSGEKGGKMGCPISKKKCEKGDVKCGKMSGNQIKETFKVHCTTNIPQDDSFLMVKPLAKPFLF